MAIDPSIEQLTYDQFRGYLNPELSSGLRDYSPVSGMLENMQDPFTRELAQEVVNKHQNSYLGTLRSNPMYYDPVYSAWQAGQAAPVAPAPVAPAPVVPAPVVPAPVAPAPVDPNNYFSTLSEISNRQNLLGYDLYQRENDTNWYADNGADFYNMTSFYDKYNSWQDLDPNYGALAQAAFGNEGIVKGADGKLYSQYGLIVGDLANNGFTYDKDASIATENAYDSIYRSTLNPEFSVTDYRTNAYDYLEHPEIFFADKFLNENGTVDGWADWFPYSGYTLADIGKETSPGVFPVKEAWTQYMIDNNLHGAYAEPEVLPYPDDDNADFSEYNASWKEWKKWNENQYNLPLPSKNILPTAKPQIADPGIDVRYSSDRDTQDNTSLNMKQSGYNALLNPTEPVLIDMGDGQYETWGRFAKYNPMQSSDIRYEWDYFPEADTYEEWKAGAPPEDALLGASSEGYMKEWAPQINSDLKNTPWIIDDKYGQGYTFREDQTDDWGFAAAPTTLEIKQKSALAEFAPMLLNVVSYAFPVLRPFVAAYNVYQGIDNENWAQAIGGALSIPGVSDALGISGLASGISDTLGVSADVGNALVQGGLSAAGSALSGSEDWLQAGFAGGLGSYAGSYIGDFGDSAATSGALSALTRSSVEQLINNGDVDLLKTMLSGAGGLTKGAQIDNALATSP